MPNDTTVDTAPDRVILTVSMALWTQADIDKLKTAVASGVLSVEYAGPPAHKITYQSLAEMRALLAQMERSVNGTTTYRLAAVNKGLG